jgi:hypothetical protein
MKRPLSIAFLLTLFNITFGQTDTLKFKQFGDSIEFSELNLNSDKTFIFHHYNMRSCWTWYSVHGIWQADKEKIIFTDTLHWEEENLKFDTSVNHSDFVLIKIKNDKGTPLKNIEIKYNIMWAENPITYLSDQNGEIKISKTVLDKQKRKEFDNNNVQFAIKYGNQKYSEISMSTSFESLYDKIELTVVDKQKEEDIIRTTTYKIDGFNIFFESQKYTGDKGYLEMNWGNFKQHVGQTTTGKIRIANSGDRHWNNQQR